MTETESEWDDRQRQHLIDLADFERHVCSGCGWHESLANHPENEFQRENHVCQNCADGDRLERIRSAREADELGENPPPERPRPSDGRSTYLRPTKLAPID